MLAEDVKFLFCENVATNSSAYIEVKNGVEVRINPSGYLAETNAANIRISLEAKQKELCLSGRL